MEKYLNIHIDSEKENIGIVSVDIKQLDKTKTLEELETPVKLLIEEKLIRALAAHFDCEIKIRKTYVQSILAPIEFKIDVIICSMDEDYEETVYLKETWIY